MQRYMSNADVIKMHLQKSEQDSINEACQEKIKDENCKKETCEAKDKFVKNSVKKEAECKAAREFSESVTSYLVETSIGTIFDHIVEEECGNTEDLKIGHSIIKDIVESNNPYTMLRTMATKNLVLSQISSYCEEYHDLLMESAKKECEKCNEDEDFSYKMDKLIADEFIDKIKEVVPEKAIKIIRNRVAKSITDFIDQQAEDKATIMDIYNKANEKIKSLPAATTESVIADYKRIAKSEATKVYSKNTNLFGAMVRIFGENVVKTRSAGFINESGSINMKKVINLNSVVYTVMETVNTMEFCTITEDDIKQMLVNNKNK